MEEELRDCLCKYMKQHSRLRLRSNAEAHHILSEFAKQLGTNIPVSVDNFNEVLSELWDMAMERIVRPEWSEITRKDHFGLNGFKLTEYGKAFLEGPPIDRPSQYIDFLTEQAPAISGNDEIVNYVWESLTAYNHGCYFSSTVMLGVASERLFDILLDAYIDYIPSHQTQVAQDRFKKAIDGRTISTQYEEFMKKLPDLTGSAGIKPKHLARCFKQAIEVTFNSIRSYRNYSAHPRTNGVVPRDFIQIHLGCFPLFCQHFYNAIEWLKNET